MIADGHYDAFIGAPLTSGMCAGLGFINSAPAIQAGLAYAQHPTKSGGDPGQQTIAMVKGLEEQIPTEEYGTVLLCDNSKACVEAVEAGKADVAAGTWAGLEYYIYETGSTLVTSLLPGQNMDADIAVSRDCDTQLLAAMNNYIYSISEDELAGYLSTGNLHPDSSSVLLFARRYPVQAMMAVTAVTALVAAIVVCLLLRASRQRAKMQAVHNRQLSQALQIARDANEAKTTFLSNMSHDIRTPMNAVIGFSTLLAREPDNAVKVREYARKISAASNHLLGLINDILDISKIESGKLFLRQSVFSLDELMESVNIVIRPMAGEKKQSFQVNMGKMAHELELLRQLQDSGEIIRGVMDPDSNPYAWYEGETARGIAADIFKATADRLGLTYEIVPVSTKEEYQAALDSGSVDVWMDMDGCYEDEGGNRYKGTDAYLTTTMSVLRHRGAAEKIERLVTDDEHITVKEIVSRVWPEAEVTVVDSLEQCREMVLSGQADTALLMSYSAQKLARDDVQNRLQVDIVPGAFLELRMGVNANDSVHFYGLWEKTLGQVADDMSEEVVQRYLEETATPNLLRYLFDHPVYFIAWCAVIFLLVLMVLLYVQSVKSKRRQEKISGQLAVALERAEEATQAKQEFFSKMSHDIRTPMNAVLGMTQVAQKYKNDGAKLDNALNAEIATELLEMVGLRVEWAENGKVGIQRYEASAPDEYFAVFMDMQMPVMDGVTATRLIRQSSRPDHDIPIFAMTANTFASDRRSCREAGMTGYIPKPVSVKNIEEALTVIEK